MPNTTHNVFYDKGYQLQAKTMAQQIMAAAPKCSIEALPTVMEELLTRAYLRGAQDSINTGYKLAEMDFAKNRQEWSRLAVK